ncbi:MAG: hypothetical protein M5U31_03890 [Acidimicrobiia bacterium]|nr:hypothetical protein [Acidimicrobiia bacterium]
MTDEVAKSEALSNPGASGKRALYSRPMPDSAVGPDGPTPRAPGKEALYSTAQRQAGTVVLECSSCGARTRVPYTEFARRHLPFWLWIPGKRHSRLMRCPACEERTWVGARWLL